MLPTSGLSFFVGGPRFMWRDQLLDQDEWHLLGRVDVPDIGSGRPGDNEAAAVAAHRWWSLADLRLSADRFFPEGLVEIVERLHRQGPPAEPLHISGE